MSAVSLELHKRVATVYTCFSKVGECWHAVAAVLTFGMCHKMFILFSINCVDILNMGVKTQLRCV